MLRFTVTSEETAATWEGHGFGENPDSIGNLHYQFGRPVPMPATLGGTIDSIVREAQTFAFAVKNPMTFIIDSPWSTQDNSSSYLWADKNVGRYEDAKSFFDPSPIGWRLPRNGVWSDFAVQCDFITDNVTTYTLGSTGTANYYAVGRRTNNTSVLSNIGTYSVMWTSTPGSTTAAYTMALRETSAAVALSTYTRYWGLSLRAVRE